MLSYRHAFHAGNHADVLKHFVLIELLRYFNRKGKPWWYVDTHAGAGCYALDSEQAGKNAEFASGIGRLWQRDDLPDAMRPYLDALAQFNPHGRLTFYPGSPALAMTQLREQDRMRLFELHPADVALLGQTFARDVQRVQVRKADGFSALRGLLPPPSRRVVVLIDPPYEVKEDYRRVVDTLADAIKRFPAGTYAVWYPLLARTEARQLPARLAGLGAENWLDVRLAVKKPPRDGFGMFGSGLYVVNPPWVLPQTLEAVMPWLADVLGEDGEGGFDLEHHIE
ncbi:23S rRNA (adenine(2030)-N(6))-methyltransferase RlmJ [Aromatoleum aromaticum]|uniref:23S rRNA (adenine(2030)-N(6))-methyltransferase RlmJ n=1 Tax=Aromatoleum aromaticum TaxID=551760 RepID=UPI0014592899|nr:23S rRNA (adenine(2030)-N(6))-methyltransferase RlmJ [Aromatoleum aromaticum]NMG54042.1 23S rRNA (adenine(2030)-N(6))-methyltransferase RlmJ [Aromatoleum aromaticum]